MKKVLVMFLMSTLGLSQTMADNQVKDVVVAQATETRASAFSGGTGSEEDPFQVTKAEDLVQLSNDINGGELYTGKYFKVMNDIDMSSVENFLPIGNNIGSGGLKVFCGIFDGGNNIISGINASYEGINAMGVALFGVTQSATIKNVRIDNSSFKADAFVCPIVAVSFGTTVQNCHSGKGVNVNATVMGGAGIVASSMGMPSVIEDCSSYASVEVGASFGVGSGIVGNVTEGASGTIIRRCVNYGNVNVKSEQAAGILAFVEYPAVIEDCANFGEIYSAVGVGGISYIAPKPDKDHLKVSNCYNVGYVEGGEVEKVDAVCLGNIFEGGGEESCKVENCYYDDELSGASSRTSTAMLTADMQTEDFVAKLNNGRENGPWRLADTELGKYPVPCETVATAVENATVETEAVINYEAGLAIIAGVKGGSKFAVVDMAGRTVKMAAANENGNLIIDLTNVPAGVYVIGNGEVSKKIVK